jgi:serine protease inhibitor
MTEAGNDTAPHARVTVIVPSSSGWRSASIASRRNSGSSSAATSVEMRLTSMPITGFQVAFDRPFVYGIVDTQTGAPLFLGLVEDPSAK